MALIYEGGGNLDFSQKAAYAALLLSEADRTLAIAKLRSLPRTRSRLVGSELAHEIQGRPGLFLCRLTPGYRALFQLDGKQIVVLDIFHADRLGVFR